MKKSKRWISAVVAAVMTCSVAAVALSGCGKKPEPEEPDEANKLHPISQYLKVDSGFSPADFKEKLSNLYIRMQNDWQDKDISELRPYMTDAFYAQMKRQLDQLRKAGQTNYVQRPTVLGTNLLGWRQDGGRDIIIAQLKTRIVDFIKDDVTGAVVRGSESKEKLMTYEWTLTRTTGVKTTKSAGLTTHVCPHCGANVDINQSTECPYCGSILTTDTFDWAIDNITALEQKTK